jgi:hypothetical protein
MSAPRKPIHPLLILLAGMAIGVLFTAIAYTWLANPDDCKGDSLCEGGQSVMGVIFWGALMTTFLLPPLVMVTILIFGIMKSARFWKKRRGAAAKQESKPGSAGHQSH